jgi:hypothetical protein
MYSVRCLIILLVLSVGLDFAASAEGIPPFQNLPVTLSAAKTLPEDLRAGSNFQVDDTIINDGLINTYYLQTNYGKLKIVSDDLYLERINELRALAHMEKLEQTKEFGEAMKKGAKAPINTVKSLATEPVGTVKAISSGISNWVSDIGSAVVSDDPNQAGVFSTAIGYAAAKRAFAYEYGINPYTDFQQVQDKMGEIARANVVGGLTPKIAFGLIKKPVGTVLSVTATADSMKKMARDKSPDELEDINEEKLKAMGVPDDLSKKFLRNYNYDPLEKTLLVGALDAMKGVAKRDLVILSAAHAPDKSVANYLRVQAQMILGYHQNISPAKTILNINGGLALQNAKGAVVGISPYDYAAWTSTLNNKEVVVSEALKRMQGVTGKELWVAGRIAHPARTVIESRGWVVHDRVREKLIK